MIPVVLGLPAARSSYPVYRAIQDHFKSLGVGTYMPQLRHAKSYNLGLAYDWQSRTLARSAVNGAYGWTADMINEFVSFGDMAMVYSHNSYYALTSPNALRWRGRDGVEYTVATIPTQMLVNVLRDTHEWFTLKLKVKQPYIFFDEPVFPGYGDQWTREYEENFLKFFDACQSAGWRTHIAAPGGTYPYWGGSRGLRPDVWLFTVKGAGNLLTDARWAPVLADARNKTGPEIWLYNAREAVEEGLAKLMRLLNATGYQDYDVTHTTRQEPRVPPLTVDEKAGTWSKNGTWKSLFVEIAKLDAAPVYTPEQKLDKLWNAHPELHA